MHDELDLGAMAPQGFPRRAGVGQGERRVSRVAPEHRVTTSDQEEDLATTAQEAAIAASKS